MSLYNTLFGMKEETPVLLGMIGVNKEYFSRFRDVELIDKGNIIRVFTRLGGENRKNYQKKWEEIKNHTLYIRDYDDNFDETYAYIEFNIPQKYKGTAKKMFKKEPDTFEYKFKKEMEEMNKPGTEAYEKAEKIAKQFMDGLKSGNGIQIIEL